MRSLVTALLSLVVVATAVLATSGIALAASPTNDTSTGAIIIPTIPFTDTVDTTEATTDAEDAALNANCGAPATDASVWYTITPEADSILLADVTGSDYLAGVIVATGEAGNLALVACGPDIVAFEARAGETYFILAFDDQGDGGGNGGTLVITVEEAPPPPELELTVDPVATFNNQSGTATVSGTLLCEGQAEFVVVSGVVQQRVGRFVVEGSFFVEDLACDGTVQEWSAEVTTNGARFAGGKATVEAFATACGTLFCSDAFVGQQVRLRR